jgi:hypothetical protein
MQQYTAKSFVMNSTSSLYRHFPFREALQKPSGMIMV